jgi:aldehyde dehydrogenase (NAD+)
MVLVEEIVREEFVDKLCKAMDEYYPVSSYADDGAVGGGGIGRGRRRGDVGRMISSTCRVIYGGRHHDRRAAIRSAHDSTIVETTFDSAVMREEVFGPVLAIVPVPSVDDALRLVN